MTYRCMDFESTGLPIEGGPPCGLMEVGFADLRFGFVHKPESALVDCGIPVSIEARAVHHISDEMVAGEISPTQAVALVAKDMKTEGDYYCAHNIDFEQKFFGGGDVPWICTYKTALRLWPDAPGHKLMELRYHLNLDDQEDFDPKLADPPHRAPADAYVCAHLLRKVLAEAANQKVDHERLVKWSSGPGLLIMCWLKKHKGQLWSTVAREDRPYLQWIVDSDMQDRDIRATARYWLKQTAPML